MRKNLVIVRAGDRSLHPAWVDNSERNWDLMISYYGNRSNPFSDQYEYFDSVKGGKWDGLHSTITRHSTIISLYERVWLPDDDLLTSTQKINKFFEICETEDLTLAQPALELSSYVSHAITYRWPKTRYRLTNFVEIMAPCMTVDFLDRILDKFQSNSSGWGFEWYWEKLVHESNQRMGIIDEVSIIHSRPVGSAGHGTTSCPYNAMKEFLELHKLEAHVPRTLKYVKERSRFSLMTNEFFIFKFQKLYNRLFPPII